MFTIIQSNDTQKLAERLLLAYKIHSTNIFDEFVVIVPAKVLEEWLKKTIAKRLGVSSLFTTQFWGQYQWQLIGRVLECDARYLAEQNDPNLPRPMKVPETALLGGSVIRWRLFSYLADEDLLKTIADDENHALHPLLSPLFDDTKTIAMTDLWRFCDGIARLYVGYLTERTDWLDKWTAGQRVNVEALIADKEKMSDWYGDTEYLKQQGLLPLEFEEEQTNTTPDWLVLYYQNLEQALRFLWKTQFAGVYRYRIRLENRFWQVLEDKTHPAFLQKNELLPKPLYLFTVQQLPQIELDFLKRLSLYTDIVLFHFNPSMAYWADIKDKGWLQTQQVTNKEKVQFFDYGHGLLSRLGKSARETFAMLSDMAGGGNDGAWQPIWQDIFNETLANTAPTTLLEYLKADILQLQESPFDNFELSTEDDSLVIHNCHSLKRQLEIARLLIAKWLNGTGKDGKPRQLSDIAIMLPDIQSHHELIRSVFVAGVGMDGLQLPAQITGVVDESTHKLWAAILGVYQLPAGRLYADEFFDWLVNPYVYQAFGLTFEQALRAIDLLLLAGFVRGLDERHLKQTLHDQDTDFRRTLAFAIDRLSLSLSMETGITSDMLYPFVWQRGQMIEKTATLAGVTLDDVEVVQALCGAYLAIVSVRDDYEQKKSIEEWLKGIEKQVINRYFYLFRDTQNLKSIFDTMNAMKASIRANNSHHYAKQKDNKDSQSIQLPLKFVLDALSDGILSQQIAAEPSGMITFGRFGSLRGIGFGLVIMLGMNLSEFPRTEPINRLDLKKAGLPRRGDRISEDDDNGAFLEAMLQARDNCWIFYDGQSSDGKKQLPASPVGELLAFLKGLDWEFESIESQLIKIHTPTPFHQDNFETNTGIVSPILWQNVYNAMLGERKTPSNLIELPNEQKIEEGLEVLAGGLCWSGTINLSGVVTALKNPAKAYLGDKLFFVHEIEESLNEPLALNHLDNYKLNQLMIDKDKQTINELLYGTTLPAGVSRQTLLDEKERAIGGIFELYHNKLSQYQIKTRVIQLSDEIICLNGIDGVLKLQVKLPKNNDIWHMPKIQSFGMDKLIECYLLHLCWQIQLNQSSIDNNHDSNQHRSFWFFCKEKDKSTMVVFHPMNKKYATDELILWLNFYELIRSMPICLTPKSAMDYLENQQQNLPKTPEKLFEGWLKEPYQTDFLPEDSCHHRYWQTILGNHDPLSALMMVLPIANRVYRGLFFNAQIINE